jgi:hypothetical protein
VGCLRLNKRKDLPAASSGNVTEGQGASGDQSCEGAVRVVMRKIGNLELILNSRLFSGMACKKG